MAISSRSEKEDHPRTFRPGMRIGVTLPDGRVSEIPPTKIMSVLVGGRIPDELPWSGYPVVIL